MSVTNVQEEEVVAEVSPRSPGGSLFETTTRITADNVDAVRSDQTVVDAACNELTHLGFTIQHVAPTTITITGTPSRFQAVFGVSLQKQQAQLNEDAPEVTTSFFAAPGRPDNAFLEAPANLAHLIEGVALGIPPILFESALPPIVAPNAAAYRYLTVPDDVAVITNAARIHRSGARGLGVKVAMIDTGQYKHPFFNHHGYRVSSTLLGPGAADPAVDSVGHGTGESANIFACAPDIQLIPVKMANDTAGAFKVAIDQKPQIITNSWGYHIDLPGTTSVPAALKPLEAAVADAVSKGIVVCFSAGNGHFGWPGSHPDVISVGGVHVNHPNLDLEASNYASSFDSSIYPGRHVPDLCGLVGRKVSGRAPLIMLPIPPGCDIDTGMAGGGLPDGTTANDGWGLFSGTSAASPQVAGVVALLLEKSPALKPAEVRTILKKSATDVKVGTSSQGQPAGAGPDAATGAGLVNAKWAWLITMGDLASRFFEAPLELQREMVISGQMPRLNREFMEDLVDTLRSR